MPPRPTWLVGEVIGKMRFPGKFIEALSYKFKVTKEDGVPLSMESCTKQGLHTFLGPLAYGVNPVPDISGINHLVMAWYGKVNLLHSLFSVLDGLYSMAQKILAFLGDLSDKGLPPVVEITTDAFAVQRAVRTVPRADHVSHLDGVTLILWQSMLCNWSRKILHDGQDLF